MNCKEMGKVSLRVLREQKRLLASFSRDQQLYKSLRGCPFVCPSVTLSLFSLLGATYGCESGFILVESTLHWLALFRHSHLVFFVPSS